MTGLWLSELPFAVTLLYCHVTGGLTLAESHVREILRGAFHPVWGLLVFVFLVLTLEELQVSYPGPHRRAGLRLFVPCWAGL